MEVEKKISHHVVYININKFYKFSGELFDERLKQANIATNHGLNDVEQCAIENEKKKYKHLCLVQYFW